jgi:hypothetical protein
MVKALSPIKVIKQFGRLKGQRGNWEDLWQDLADYINPRKDDVTGFKSPGEKKFVNLFDSTAMISCELLAGALHGMLTNPSGQFFGLSTGDFKLDSNDSVRLWIQQVVRLIHDQINKSNFQTEGHEMYIDLCSFGTSPMQIEEDEETVIRFMTRALKEVFIEENYKGVVDCVYRSYCCDARCLVEEFGLDLPKKVMDAFNAGKDDKFEVIHAIYPKTKVPENYKGKKSGEHSFVSQYILVSEKIDLHVGGFNELPYVVPRWSKYAGEIYGRGPGEKALAEAKVCNKMAEVTLSGAQKTIDPPLMVPDDGFIMPLYTTPGGMNFYRAGSEDMIKPIFNDARIDFGYQAITMKQTAIREAFYVDQLKLREGPQMTATEVQERVEQALRFLGPMLGRMQSEFLQPMIERVYQIMDRKGLIPEPPEELAGIELKIQYISVMAMAQRASELSNIKRTMDNIAVLASIDPTCTDIFDATETTKYIAKLCNFPQEAIRNKKDLDGMREQRAKVQQEQIQAAKQADSAEQTNKLASAASKVISKTG